jgi:hypothetical protein
VLPLVRSQRACIERIRSAVRWAKRLVVLVGAPGQGKSTVVEALVLRSPVNPLCLEGELISYRTDAVLRLMGLVGLRPAGIDIEMLARLQNKQPAGTEDGIPEIIVDDAHCLPNDVLQLFHELSSGAYGRRWSVLMIGEETLVRRLQTLTPKPVLSSAVLLPRWDHHDLEEACANLYPTLAISTRTAGLLQNYAMHPKQLLRAVAEADPIAALDRVLEEKVESLPLLRIAPTIAIAIGFAMAALIAILIFVQMDNDNSQTITPTTIPLIPNKQ